tara:strand:- start:1210 stop:1449 length:240 start_codon:yes stop_codon:yes gene_type:complete
VLPHQNFGAAQSFSLVSEKRYLWFWWWATRKFTVVTTRNTGGLARRYTSHWFQRLGATEAWRGAKPFTGFKGNAHGTPF